MRNAAITTFLEERIAAGDFPSAVYLVAEVGEARFIDALGNAVVEPERIPARTDTIYDLASLTKVLVTGLLTAMLIEGGRLDLDATVGSYIDPIDPGDKSLITLRQLLTHTSGFRSWLPLYLLVSERPEVLAEIIRTPLRGDGQAVVYSDLNFLTLTFILERLFDEPIDEAARRLIFEPLGLGSTYFNPPSGLRPQIAASENGNAFERQTCADLGYGDEELRTPILRRHLIWGEVHDGNAYFMGGVAGHAGVFGNAADVLKIAQQFVPASTALLRPETCGLFTTNFTPRADEHRSLAFQLASTAESTAGSRMSAQSFGHLGFTGTSLWIDPVKERIFILLTNRTHHHPLPLTNINSTRRRFHDLAIEALDK